MGKSLKSFCSRVEVRCCPKIVLLSLLCYWLRYDSSSTVEIEIETTWYNYAVQAEEKWKWNLEIILGFCITRPAKNALNFFILNNVF